MKRRGGQRPEQAVEARREAVEGGGFKPIRRGWCLGEKTFRQELLAHRSGRMGASITGRAGADGGNDEGTD